MRFDKIINNPKNKLNSILESLAREYTITIDFNDSKGLRELQEAAIKIVKLNKEAKSIGIFESANDKGLHSAYLILEAIKLNKNIKIVENTEIEKAEYLLASKDIVDDLQKMVENVSKIMAEKVPAIVDRIKVEQGIEAAEKYKTSSKELLVALIDLLGTTKDSMDNLTLELSGETIPQMQSPVPEYTPPAAPAQEQPALPAEPEDAAAKNPLGRERKEESTKKSGKALNESVHDVMIEDAKFAIEKLVKRNNITYKEAIEHYFNAKNDEIAKFMNPDILEREVWRYYHRKGLMEAMDASEANGLKCWKVKATSPKGEKLFGNFKVFSPTSDIAKVKVKKHLDAKHGLVDYNFSVEEMNAGSKIPKAMKESTDVKHFVVKLKHDKGVINIKTTSTSAEAAKKAVLAVHKNAPESAIIDVKELGPVVKESTDVKHFVVKLKHDKGVINIKTTSTSAEAAKKAVLAVHKNAPESAIIDVKELGPVVKESWDTKMHTAAKDKGKWEGWTKEELKHKLSALMKKKEHSAEDTKTIKQIEFALRAKGKGKSHSGKWGKIKESTINDFDIGDKVLFINSSDSEDTGVITGFNKANRGFIVKSKNGSTELVMPDEIEKIDESVDYPNTFDDMVDEGKEKTSQQKLQLIANEVKGTAESLVRMKGINFKQAVDEIIGQYAETIKHYATPEEIKSVIFASKVSEDSNSAQTQTAQQKPMPTMWAKGTPVMQGTKPVIVATDNNDPNSQMVAVQDAPNGPTRMVPKNQLTQAQLAQAQLQNANESKMCEACSGKGCAKCSGAKCKKVKMHIESIKGKKGTKTFESEKHAKGWLKTHGHHVKKVHKLEEIDEDMIEFPKDKIVDRSHYDPKTGKLVDLTDKSKPKAKTFDLRGKELDEGNGDWKKCHDCHGHTIDSEGNECKTCDGEGSIGTAETCDWCNGTGFTKKGRTCPQCDGEGSVKIDENAAAGSTGTGAVAQTPQSLFKKPIKRTVDEDVSSIWARIEADKAKAKSQVNSLEAAKKILGNRSSFELKHMIKALGMHEWNNDADDWKRLYAAKLMLKSMKK